MAYEEEKKYNQLEELKGSDYQIVEGEPDIEGWDVIDGEGRKIGEVEDVLFDPNTRDVRYIIVDLEENELEIDTDKKVLVPIGIAELPVQEENTVITTDEGTVADQDDDDDEDLDDDDTVYLPTVTAAHLLALPAYETGGLTPDNELAIRNVFEEQKTDAVVVYDPASWYTHEQFNNKIYPRRGSPYPEQFDENTGTGNDTDRPDRPAL